jgi:hypothetical protein
MRNRLAVSAAALIMAMTISPLLRSQAPASSPGGAAAGQAGAASIPDLSGTWAPDPKRGGIGQSLSMSDMGGRNRGKEEDIPYLPWALEKTLSERPSTGGGAEFDKTTDPQVLYCEPPGVPHIYLWPIRTKFIQAPEAVYILHELGPFFRVVWLNAEHPEDPDPQWWGHSIGHYENGDTLVVDTVGFNGRQWLDQVGHPQTEQLHLIERYTRIDENSLELNMVIDDPGAYTKPWPSRRNFTLSPTGFLRYQQICSVRENQEFFDNLAAPAIAPSAGR